MNASFYRVKSWDEAWFSQLAQGPVAQGPVATGSQAKHSRSRDCILNHCSPHPLTANLWKRLKFLS